MPDPKNLMLDIETYLEAAKWHGEDSEPDHEVGDLQDYLRRAWALMTPEQRLAFAKDEDNQDYVRNNTSEQDHKGRSFNLEAVEDAIDELP